MTKNGHLYLIDFDLSTLGDDDAAAAFVGTVAYMAPESLEKLEYSQLSDIWSLGATLFHLMTGHLMLFPEPEEVREFTLLPLAIRRLLGWMLEQDPRRRPADMSVVRNELGSCLRSLENRTRLVPLLRPYRDG